MLTTFETKAIEEANAAFFTNNPKAKSLGAVETPEAVVDLMVQLAIRHRDPELSQDLKWLDPCCGTGAFVLGILRSYIQMKNPQSIPELPQITMVEVDASALNVARRRIERLLIDVGLSIDAYMSSGRLQVVEGDFLELAAGTAQLGLFTTPPLGKFGIIIGNPPYVRSSTFSRRTKYELAQQFSDVHHGTLDLYGYFYAVAPELLEPDGVLSFITPFNFAKTPAATRLRNQLLRSLKVVEIQDFGERPIFVGAAVHCGIFTFSRKQSFSSIRFVDRSRAKGSFSSDEEMEAEVHAKILSVNAAGQWILRDQVDTPRQVLYGKTLRTEGVRVYSGIRSGFRDAFVFNEEQLSKFTPETRRGFFVPLIMPSDISRGTAVPSRYLLNLKRGGILPNSEVLRWLTPHRSRLARRPEVEGREEWYALRPCSYTDEMARKKIVFPDISTEPRFAICGPNILISDGAYFLSTDDLALLAILNSHFSYRYFAERCQTIGSLSSGGRMRFKRSVVQDFPLPNIWGEDDTRFDKLRELGETLVSVTPLVDDKTLIDEISEIAESLYGGESR